MFGMRAGAPGVAPSAPIADPVTSPARCTATGTPSCISSRPCGNRPRPWIAPLPMRQPDPSHPSTADHPDRLRFGGLGKKALVRAMYSSYPGRREVIVFSSMPTPDTRISSTVMTIGPMIDHHASPVDRAIT